MLTKRTDKFNIILYSKESEVYYAKENANAQRILGKYE